MKQTIIIIDDHALLRETWGHLISRNENYQITGSFGSAEEALQEIAVLQPHLALLDINLPGMTGLEATLHFKERSPQTKIIGVSMHNQPTYAKQMIRNGAYGYITKSSGTQELFEALAEVAAGRRYICEEIKNIMADQLGREESPINLSGREVEVIRFLREGMSSKEIAERMAITTKTVEVHRYNILKKLKLKNTAALVQHINNDPTLLS